MGTTKVSLKLLVDTKANKVLFAEASKDFEDFLLHILSLPIGTAIKLMTAKGMVGCLGDLYTSVEAIDTDYLQPNFDVGSLLKPRVADVNVPLLSLKDVPDETSTIKFYVCSYGSNHRFVSDAPGAFCPDCNRSMFSEMRRVAPKDCASEVGATYYGKSGGYVKGVVTYMVMDNLEVKPMSTISGITFINRFNVKDVGALVDKQVEVGLEQGIAMLKASMELELC